MNKALQASPSALLKMSGQVVPWKLLFLLAVLVIVGNECQTFQYSRGWTNGKRSGGSSVPLLDLIDQPPLEELRLARQNLRTIDYSPPFGTRKLSLSNRKPPLWVGPIFDQDGGNEKK